VREGRERERGKRRERKRGGKGGEGKTLWICSPRKNFLATPLQGLGPQREGELWGLELPVRIDAAYRQITLALVLLYGLFYSYHMHEIEVCSSVSVNVRPLM